MKTRTYDDVDGENVSRKNEARLKTICSHRMGFYSMLSMIYLLTSIKLFASKSDSCHGRSSETSAQGK